MSSKRRNSLDSCVIGFLLLTCALSVGCRTPKGPGADSLASIQVTAQEPLAIARALSRSFQEAGFQSTPLPRNRDLKMMFEKEGTAADVLMYGDWSFTSVWYRAKLEITPLRNDQNPNNYLVTCNVFRVTDRGDRHFEEEHRLRAAKRGFFQDLLNKAKADLQANS